MVCAPALAASTANTAAITRARTFFTALLRKRGPPWTREPAILGPDAPASRTGITYGHSHVLHRGGPAASASAPVSSPPMPAPPRFAAYLLLTASMALVGSY